MKGLELTHTKSRIDCEKLTIGNREYIDKYIGRSCTVYLICICEEYEYPVLLVEYPRQLLVQDHLAQLQLHLQQIPYFQYCLPVYTRSNINSSYQVPV
jgi:hypothetical protein